MSSFHWQYAQTTIGWKGTPSGQNISLTHHCRVWLASHFRKVLDQHHDLHALPFAAHN